METEFNGFYLGSDMLTKGTTGLGVIQKPLREKYFALRKSSSSKLGQEICIRVNPNGITLLSSGKRSGGPLEEFYEIASIHFIEAVHFVTIQHKEKTFLGAFIPIEGNNDASQDKLFVPLEKKFKHLTKISHPPMVACVMRRSSGVKAVDCHMFVFSRIEDALNIANTIHRFQMRHENTEFYYGPSTSERRDMNLEQDLIPRNLGSRDLGSPAQGLRDPNESSALFKGRGYILKQEHLQTPDENNLRYSNSDINRRYDRPLIARNDMNNTGVEMRYGYGSDLRDRYNKGHSAPDQFLVGRPNEYIGSKGVFVERDTLGREYEFDNRQPMHERQRSGGSRSDDRDCSGFAPKNEYLDRSDGSAEFETRFNRNPNKFPPGILPDRSSEPIRGPLVAPFERGGISRDDQREFRTQNYEVPSYPRPVPGDGRRSPPPPRAQSPYQGSSPRALSPLRDENTFSASNLESRQEADLQGKPVAKVPPNRVTGVRVLPSLPIPGVKNHLRPVSPRAADPNVKADSKAPVYSFSTKMDQDENAEQYDNAPEQKPYRQNRIESDNLQYQKRPDGHRQDINSRVKSDDYSCSSSKKDSERNVEQTNNSLANSMKPWSFDDEKQKFLKTREPVGWNVSTRSRSAQDFQDKKYQQGNAEKTDINAKDAEIADMFSYLNTSYGDQNEAGFEKTLGYLP